MIQMTRGAFERLVLRAYSQLPEGLLRRLENVDIVVEEWPGPDEAELLGEHDTLFGLYQGWPLTERDGIGPALPDRSVIYRPGNPSHPLARDRPLLGHDRGRPAPAGLRVMPPTGCVF